MKHFNSVVLPFWGRTEDKLEFLQSVIHSEYNETPI